MIVLRDVEVDGRHCDVRLSVGVVESVEPAGATAADADDVVDGRGGALLPGLHDHHIHLLATARARTSIDVSDGLAALATAPPGTGWLRAVNSMDDDLDAVRLDTYVADRPVRVQHHGGALWTLNTEGMRRLGVDPATGGRLFRADGWLATRLAEAGHAPEPDELDLATLGAELVDYGITGVTDATPALSPEATQLLRTQLPQHVHVLGRRKIVLSDDDLPTYDDVRAQVAALHETGEPIAVHCATREALALLIAVLDDVGPLAGDRVEHASVTSDDAAKRLAELGVAVVTQPGFIANRGDRYLRDVDRADRADLYRFAGLRAAGVTVAASSDAPYGPLDPWTVIRAARDRRTEAGRPLGPAEAVDARVALAGYLLPPDDLHTAPRRVEPGAPADLVLLHVPLAEALADPNAGVVRQTWISGAPA